MRSELRPALLSLALLTILTGAIYPAVVTGIAHLAFRRQAEGSLIPRDGKRSARR
jgi:K+-transporting ATPase ATPase C chain